MYLKFNGTSRYNLIVICKIVSLLSRSSEISCKRGQKVSHTALQLLSFFSRARAYKSIHKLSENSSAFTTLNWNNLEKIAKMSIARPTRLTDGNLCLPISRAKLHLMIQRKVEPIDSSAGERQRESRRRGRRRRASERRTRLRYARSSATLNSLLSRRQTRHTYALFLSFFVAAAAASFQPFSAANNSHGSLARIRRV